MACPPRSRLETKTWRLYITPYSGMTLYSLEYQALLSAITEKFRLEDAHPSLTLSSEKRRYCATISLQYSVSPFTNQEPFDLDIMIDDNRKVIVNVEPDDTFLRMTTLYDGTYDDDAVDIIMVPGLASHPYGSFKSPRDAKENWLRDYLPKSLPNIRVLVHGYNSSLRRDSKESISDFAKVLLQAIHEYRNDALTRSRPIILLGHSLGGLIIKQALVQAERNNTEEDKAFLDKCHGFIFFGVPNRGLRHEELAAILYPKNPTSELVQNIVVDEDTEAKDLLKELGTSFMNTYRRKKKMLDIKAFYEKKKSFITELAEDGRTYIRSKDESKMKLMVTQDSATTIGGDFEIGGGIPLDANHSTLVKYVSRNDPLYSAVLTEIELMVGRAHKKVDGQSSEWTRRLEKFKDNADIKINDVPIDVAHSGTLQEFLTLDWFRNWRDEKVSSPLWICGPPGRGKSVLAKHLVNHLQQQSSHTQKNAKDIIILHYFFNGQDENCQPNNLLHNLILQLLGYMGFYDRVPEDFWESPNTFSSASLDNLWIRFSQLAYNIDSRHIYCIVDALDECPVNETTNGRYPGESERSKIINWLKKISTGEKARVRLLITSRPSEDDIYNGFAPYRQELVVPRKDLEAYIDSKLCEISYIRKSEGMMEDVREQLLDKADSTYLWVSIIIYELSRPARSPEKVRTLIGSIPARLEDMYSELFKLLEERESSLKRILIWVIYAKRPLSISELQAALTYDPYNKQYTQLSEMENDQYPLDGSTIDDSLGSLLVVRRDKYDRPYIFFRHQSGNEFFTSEKHIDLLHSQGDPSPDIKLALTCLFYINADGFKYTEFDSTIKRRVYRRMPKQLRSFIGPHMDNRRCISEVPRVPKTNMFASYPLLHYASMNWHQHILTKEDSEHENVAAQIKLLIDKGHHSFKLWIRCFIEIRQKNVVSIFLRGKRPRATWEPSPTSVLVSIILHLNIPWLSEKIPNDDLIGLDYELASMAVDTPESFESICRHRWRQMPRILSATFFKVLPLHSRRMNQTLRILFKSAPGMKFSIDDDILERRNPLLGSIDDYKDLVELLTQNGIPITDGCLKMASGLSQKDTLEFLFRHRESNAEISDEHPIPVVRISDEIFTSAIEQQDTDSFVFLLKHMGQTNGNEENNHLLELLFQCLPDENNSNSTTFMDQKQLLDNSVEFNKAALLETYYASQVQMKISVSMLANYLCNIIGADMLELFIQIDLKLEFTEEIMSALAEYWASTEDILQGWGNACFRTMKPFDFITNKQPYLSYHTWRTSLSNRKVMKILLSYFNRDLSPMEDSFCCSARENKDIVLRCLEYGQPRGHHQWTTLHYAAYFNDLEVVAAELASGVSANKATSNGLTPLHIAVLSSFARDQDDLARTERQTTFKLIKLLLKNKANPNIRDDTGAIPLHYAACDPRGVLINALLQSDRSIQDERGFTPSHHAITRPSIPHYDSRLLVEAKTVNSLDIIFQTPFHYAIQSGHLEYIDLLENDAELSLLNAYGRTCVESMQENELDTKNLPFTPLTSQSQRDVRLRNVIYILTSILLDNKRRLIHPGFYELANCLVYLGKTQEALVAYEQILPNLEKY